MSKLIKLGYELKTGKKIEIEPSHLIVTGLSQKAGKTTTLESMIKRSGQKAIVFRTKIGEKSFLDGTVIPPFFRDRSDWQYIKALIEATMREKVGRMEQAKIIQISKKTNGKSLLDFKKQVDQRLTEKINSFETDLLTNLQAYLDIVIPKLQTVQFSNTLELVDGLNIIDLERFSRDPEVQSMIIGSVLDEVLNNHKGTICLIPEAWKFIPQGKGNPCKPVVEEFIRQGATNKNFLWIDSQDMTGVDKIPLKQISEWILGYQSEKNEVKHTIDQIPLPKHSKPTPDEIMQLGTGIFIYASRDLTARVYVQPFWLDDEKSIQIAKGEIKVSEIDAPKQLASNRIAIQNVNESEPDNLADEKLNEFKKILTKEFTELRSDFFNKIGDIQDQLNKAFVDIAKLKTLPPPPEIDEDELIGKLLQKMPTPQITPINAEFDQEAIIKSVLARVPKGQGSTVYTVAPLEKITKDFLNECKDKILTDISSLNNDSKKILKYLESQGKGSKANELILKCFLMKDGGSQRTKVSNCGKELISIEVIRKDSTGTLYPRLKERIADLMGNHKATDQEIQSLYDHILMELLN